LSWTLIGMAKDGSSWGYTDEHGQGWYGSTYHQTRRANITSLRRHGIYAGWNTNERTISGAQELEVLRAKAIMATADPPKRKKDPERKA
jgi:hypothetical protein